MKQTDQNQLKRSEALLAELKQARGGTIGKAHLQLANDPALLRAFKNLYVDCCVEDICIPEKYRQLIMLALCCAKGYDIAEVHGRQAEAAGATVEEVSEVIRLVLNVCGAPAILGAMGLFEEPEVNV